jgi:hypothetical protein
MFEPGIEVLKDTYLIFSWYFVIGAIIATVLITVLMHADFSDKGPEMDQVKWALNNSAEALIKMFFFISFLYPVIIGQAFSKRGKK